MNRRILFSLPLAALLCLNAVHHARAQEELPQQASVQEQLNHQLSLVQWVKPKTAGVLKGDVFAPVLGGATAVVDNAVVVLRGTNGWVGEAATNRLGRFTITDVKPGVYSMLVKAPGLFAFYALQVVAENDVDVHAYPERARISCAFLEEVSVTRIAKHEKGEMTLGDVAIQPEGVAVVQEHATAGSPLARLIDGTLSGVLRQAGSGFKVAPGTQVTVLEDGEVVGSGMTDVDGRFEIAGLDSGIYSLVASGLAGVAVVGIEAKADAAAGGQVQDETATTSRFVALRPKQAGGPGELSIQLSPNTIGASDSSSEQNFGTPVVGVGGGGGGGGVGGGGGIAALAAGAAAAAAASGGGDSIIVASPAK